MVVIFPVSALILVDYLRLFHKHARRAKKLRQKLSLLSTSNKNNITLVSANKNERLQLKSNEILYLTSADNYAEVVYRLDLDLKKSLLWGTLKEFENQLK